MKTICFDVNDVNGAVSTFLRDYSIRLEMLPTALLKNENFWLNLLKEKPELIVNVPMMLLNDSNFVEKIDRVRFYNFIPKELLKVEDFYASRDNLDKVMHKEPHVEIESLNSCEWTKIRNKWYTPQMLLDVKTAYDIIVYDMEFPEEYFTQELAEYIWESKYWSKRYNFIPIKFRDPKWNNLMEIYKRRKNLLSDVSMERLDIDEYGEALLKYLSTFKTNDDMLLAFEIEHKIMKEWCKCNCYLVSKKRDKFFGSLWNILPEKNTAEMVRELVKILPESAFYIPEPFFQKRYLYPYIKNYVSRYNILIDTLEKSTIEVEKLETQEHLEFIVERCRKVLQIRYPDVTDMQILEFIEEMESTK